jgi:elongation factor Ts
MSQIKAADVQKLRKATGAGMMDCKNALKETDGDFDAAVDIIRKKGQAVANKRSDREAGEGVVLAKSNGNKSLGAMIVLNCETDFVAKNDGFVELATKILNTAIENKPANLDELKALKIDGKNINDIVIEQVGIIGEKLDLSYFDFVEAENVISYIHPGNKLATLVGLNKTDIDEQIGKDVAMQVAAMNPVSVSKESVPKEVVEKELEIGKDMARNEGKPENMLDKIAEGRLNKFFKESTLLSQAFIKDNKKSVSQYLKEVNPDLTVTEFKRFSLNV